MEKLIIEKIELLPFPYKYIIPKIMRSGCQLNSRFGLLCQEKPPRWCPVHIPANTTAINPEI